MAGSRLLIAKLIVCIISQPALSKSFTGFGDDVDNYIQTTAKHYQISEMMLRGLVKMENGWLNQVSPTGATGVGQFTVSTWNWLAEKDEGRALGMMRITARNRGTLADPRRNKRINTLAIGALARLHITRFRELGIRVTDENLYMAHNIGLSGLHRALLGISTKEDIRNMHLNGMKSWMSVSDFLTYQTGRFNTHKFEANFMQTKPIKWIEPTVFINSRSLQMKWIEPTTMVWIEPTN